MLTVTARLAGALVAGWLCAGLLVAPAAARPAQAPEADAASLREACDAGEADACHALGRLLEREAASREDGAREALPLYQGACDGGAPTACVEAGSLLESGVGVVADASAAEALYRRACALPEGLRRGRVEGCTYLSMMFLISGDPSRALAVYREACEAGVLGACVDEGREYARGGTVEPDADRAERLYQKACDGGAVALAPRLRHVQGTPGCCRDAPSASSFRRSRWWRWS